MPRQKLGDVRLDPKQPRRVQVFVLGRWMDFQFFTNIVHANELVGTLETSYLRSILEAVARGGKR